jgi:protein subunit release factor A
VIEAEIAQLEAKISQLSEQMSKPEIASNPQKFNEINVNYQQAESDLEKLYSEWEESTALQS